MRKLLKIVLSASLLLQPVELFAQQTKGEAVKQSVGQFAATAGTLAVVSAVSNTETGKKLTKECSSGVAAWACPLAVMSLTQVVATLATASGAKKTKSQIEQPNWDANLGTGDSSPTDYGQYGDEASFKAAVNESLSDLAKLGHKVDLKNQTYTDPSGKSHPLSALSSSKTMLAEGLIKPEDAPQVDLALKKASDRARMVAVGIAGGGGGGSGGGRATKYEYEDPYAAYDKFLNREKPNAPKTTGLTRTLASGESIGTQTDNIFHMIHRRYNQTKEVFTFVGE